MVTVDQAAAVIALARKGSLRAAATEVGISEAGVRKRIRVLESELGGVRLFDDDWRLTSEGRTFRVHAEQLLAVAKLAQTSVKEPVRAVRVGATRSVCTYVLPDILEHFHRENPAVRCVIETGHSSEVLEMVRNGAVDIGVAYSLLHADIVSTTLIKETPIVLVEKRPRGAKAKRRRPMALTSLKDRPLIVSERGSTSSRFAHDVLDRAGLGIGPLFEVDSIETVLSLVRRGIGIGFVPRLAILGVDDVAEVSVDVPLAPMRTLDLIHSRSTSLNDESAAFRVAALKAFSVPRRVAYQYHARSGDLRQVGSDPAGGNRAPR